MTTAIERIWNQHAEQLRGFIHRRIPEASVVDDVLQDVFVKIHTKIASLRDETRLQSWLYEITRNTIVDHFRSQKPEQELPETLDLPEPNETHVLEELAECVRPLMDALPERYRLPLILSELEGLSQKEVAEKLGLSLSATKSRVQRGRDRVKDLLTECCHFKLDHAGRVMDYQPRGRECTTVDFLSESCVFFKSASSLE
jgi:RNA polymerase sigma-70 factor, ECF subfamily